MDYIFNGDWEMVDTNRITDYEQVEPYYEIERRKLIDGGYLYRATTFTYQGVIMNVSIAFMPES